MNAKIPSWLQKEIRLPFRIPTVPSPLARRVLRGIQVLLLLVLCSFALWRFLLAREINHRFAQIRVAGFPTSGAELNSWHSGKPSPFLWLTGFFERDLNFYLDTMDKTISLAKLPLPASFSLTNCLETATEISQKKVYLFSGMVLPSYRIIQREASTQAAIQLAATALTVERCPAQGHGHYRAPFRHETKMKLFRLPGI